MKQGSTDTDRRFSETLDTDSATDNIKSTDPDTDSDTDSDKTT